MFKKIFAALFFLLFFPGNIYAQDSFGVNTNIEYKILDTGNVAVTHTITVKNNSTYEYAQSYLFELSSLYPTDVKAFEGGTSVPVQLRKEDDKQILKLVFPNPVTGKNKTRTFVVTYEVSGLVTRSGEVWEISIPKLIGEFDESKVVLSVPSSFGKEALISPQAAEKKENEQRNIYIFDGKDLIKSGINAVFGKFQVYSLKLTYHLKNTSDKKNTLAIAIPPDTSTQKVFFNKITPEPSDIEVDEDGNWIAYFLMPPKKSESITVEGYAQVFADPVKFFAPYPSTILANLKAKKYWEVDDPGIKELALELKTPENIYKFVTNHLTYNYYRVKPDVERLGAKSALANPSEAICTEFTDLFITLTRAAGIPAREINGYAHSDNPSLQPLSLVSDVLHAWPEYWDESRQVWIPIDPTWEATSKIDYFNKFDLKHIAFVIHGKSSVEPLSAGSYKSDELSKDIFVEISDFPPESNQSLEITYEIANKFNPFKKGLVLHIKNTGLSAQYNLSPKIHFSDEETFAESISVLPPMGVFSETIDLDIGLFAVKTPNKITVSVNRTEKEIYLNKTVFATQQLLVFFTLLLLLVLYIGVRTGRINFGKFISKIKSTQKNASKT